MLLENAIQYVHYDDWMFLPHVMASLWHSSQFILSSIIALEGLHHTPMLYLPWKAYITLLYAVNDSAGLIMYGSFASYEHFHWAISIIGTKSVVNISYYRHNLYNYHHTRSWLIDFTPQLDWNYSLLNDVIGLMPVSRFSCAATKAFIKSLICAGMWGGVVSQIRHLCHGRDKVQYPRREVSHLTPWSLNTIMPPCQQY